MSKPSERLSVSLSLDMAEAINSAIESGEYASSSEIVREALRDWRHKRMDQDRLFAELRADVQAGIDDVGAGRVRDFDADRIIENGMQRLSDRSLSR